MKQKLLSKVMLLLLALVAGSASVWGATVDDVLNQTFTGITGTSYTAFSGKAGTSGAVYAGQCAGGNSSIQLRSNNSDSGVVTTTSGGKAKKVVVEWNSGTSSGRTLNVYGKNSAYSAATDLYNASNQGTLLGTIVCGTSTELTITGDYDYIGFRSASGAMYLTSVTITWGSADASKVLTPNISGSESFLTSTEVSITCGTDGAAIQYKLGDGGWTNYSAPFTLTETTTVTAKATADGLTDSDDASKTFTKVTPMTVANAIAATPASGTSEGKYIHGYVSAFYNTSITGDGTNYRYYISDDGTKNGQLLVYRGKGLGNVAFSSVDDLLLGDEVVIYGGLTTYSSTAEVASGNYIISLSRKVSTPTFSPVAGPVVSGTEVTINCATDGATIYYTTDGNNPTTESTVYNPESKPVITAATTIKAFAVKAGNPDSEIAAASYTISVPVATPAFSPAAGTYSSAQSVTISCATDGATIYYTTNGDEPTTGSTVYTAAIDVDETTTIKAIAAKDGMANSTVAEATFTINIPSITLSTATIEATAAETEGTITVTYNHISDVAAEVQFCEADGTTPATYAWVEAEINASNNVEYVVAANKGAARTAYMRVYALDDKAKDVYSELITITQAKYEAPGSWAVVTNIADLTATDVFVIVGNNGSTYALSNDNGTSAAPTAVSVSVANGALSTAPADNIKWSISGNATDGFTFYPNGDTEKWLYCTATNNGVRVGTNDAKTFDLDASGYLKHKGTSRYLGVYNSEDWRCYTAYTTNNIKDQTFAFYKKLAVTLNSYGYATFTSTCAIDYFAAEGFTAWAITGVSGSTITFSQVKGAVPAGTGVLLMGDPSTTVYPVVASTGTAITNKLVGITTATAVTADQYYGLSGNEFVKVNAGTVPAGKALLPIEGGSAKALSIEFDNADGIVEMRNGENETMRSEVFDLSGRRVVKPTKGLYIVNGKKIMVK
ncbi:MAG: chitobiase/beta-hexosaminidase C-terminal domain-containing protein [Bacteroidaceae bacterium]|nr:chitobiase/beta-hexosaminidase C-terminal domain-containing protein [Bacteroidaceae bacterium]